MAIANLATGSTIHYIIQGKGEPLLLLHGFMGTAVAELGSLIDKLSRKYKVIAPTYRGYGKSGPKPRKFPKNFYQIDANDMLELVTFLQLGKIHLVGFSDGGEIALIMAGTKPELFASVVVWGAIGFVGPAVKEEAKKYYPATWVTDEIKARHGIEDANPMVKQWVDTLIYLSEKGGDLSISLSKNIKAPLLMMLGNEDYLNPPEYAAKVLVEAENSRLRMFKCGHRIHDELPEKFLKVVFEFLGRYKINKVKNGQLSYDYKLKTGFPVIGIGCLFALYKRKENVKLKR
jgi:valacyclovir hydrolase